MEEQDKEKNKILSSLKSEYETYRSGYTPDTRKAAEIYAGYKPSEFPGFVTEGESRYFQFPEGKSEKVAGSYDVKRLGIQNSFLSAIATGDRKEAIKIALDSEKSNSGIPLNYFSDMLDRDRLMRMAYEQDNPETAKPAIRPSIYNAIPEAEPQKTGPIQKFSSEMRGGTSLDASNLEYLTRSGKGR